MPAVPACRCSSTSTQVRRADAAAPAPSAAEPLTTLRPSLLASPAAASWRYDYQVDPQGPEQKFLDAVRNPHSVNWV